MSPRLGWALGLVTVLLCGQLAQAGVRIKDLTRVAGGRQSSIMGYGLVVGLSGTGDSSRNLVTVQSVSNMLREFGLQVPPESLNARNVAAVLVSAELPAAVRNGDRVDVNVAAIGDARSLAGGTLLMTPLLGSDRQVYASAQGALSVGGYRFERDGTSGQKNFPTTGSVPDGAVVEVTRAPALVSADGHLDLLLNEADYTTATRVALTIAQSFPETRARALDAGRVEMQVPSADPELVTRLLSQIETLAVEPDSAARVVVNERTGTVVSGGGAWISAVTVTQGALRVSVTERNRIVQPGGVLINPGDGIQTAVTPEADVRIREDGAQSVELGRGATIAELVAALRDMKASARDVIAVLQGIKRAGALHAELIIQ
ncbi:MAG TPA: flagellar basal body P-ring protein FlgI [Steroidobacteraceae bacterium]